jgi:hypothetical protein
MSWRTPRVVGGSGPAAQGGEPVGGSADRASAAGGDGARTGITPPAVDAAAAPDRADAAERRPETIMAFWIIWIPCCTTAPPVSAAARLGAWKQMIAIRIITTEYFRLSPTTLKVEPRKPPWSFTTCTSASPRYTLSPSAKKANQVSTTVLSNIDSQLSKNRAVGLQARQSTKIGPVAITKVMTSFASVTTNNATHRNTTFPIAHTTAANKRSSRVMPASLSRSRTSLLALSLNASRSMNGEAMVAGSAADGRKVVATPVAKPLAVSATFEM